MSNGRCRLHGGATPKDRQWHRVQWPKGSEPNAVTRADRKAQDVAKRMKTRRQRVAQMTVEERAAHDRWRATHAPTTAAHRAALREARRQAAQAIDVLKASPAPLAKSNDASARETEIVDLRAQIRFWDREIEIADNWNTGVFA